MKRLPNRSLDLSLYFVGLTLAIGLPFSLASATQGPSKGLGPSAAALASKAAPSAPAKPSTVSNQPASSSKPVREKVTYQKANPRKYRTFGNEAHVDELIRASEDPDYFNYLVQKRNEEMHQERLGQKYSSVRLREAEVQERLRQEYIEQRSHIRQVSKLPAFIKHEREKQKLYQQQERAREQAVETKRAEKTARVTENRKRLRAFLAKYRNEFDGFILTKKQEQLVPGAQSDRMPSSSSNEPKP